MKNFRKVYVGNGKQTTNGLETTKVTLRVADLQKLIYEYDGQKYVSLEIARMQKADKYNRTHTVYGTTMEEMSEKRPAMINSALATNKYLTEDFLNSLSDKRLLGYTHPDFRKQLAR